jgi:hypothetical protein
MDVKISGIPMSFFVFNPFFLYSNESEITNKKLMSFQFILHKIKKQYIESLAIKGE